MQSQNNINTSNIDLYNNYNRSTLFNLNGNIATKGNGGVVVVSSKSSSSKTTIVVKTTTKKNISAFQTRIFDDKMTSNLISKDETPDEITNISILSIGPQTSMSINLQTTITTTDSLIINRKFEIVPIISQIKSSDNIDITDITNITATFDKVSSDLILTNNTENHLSQGIIITLTLKLYVKNVVKATTNNIIITVSGDISINPGDSIYYGDKEDTYILLLSNQINFTITEDQPISFDNNFNLIINIGTTTGSLELYPGSSLLYADTTNQDENFIIPLKIIVLATTNTIIFKGIIKFDIINKNIDLTGAILSGTDFTNVDLTGANLSGVSLTNTTLTGTNLSGANLTDANLNGVNLTTTNLSGANLTGATLSGANLTGVNLSGVNLSYVNLTNTILSTVDQITGILTRANLNGATLTNTNLNGVNLTGFDLTNTTLTNIQTNVTLDTSNYTTIYQSQNTSELKISSSSSITRDVTYQLYQSSENSISGTIVPYVDSSSYIIPNTLVVGKYYYYYKITDDVTGSFIYTNIVEINVIANLNNVDFTSFNLTGTIYNNFQINPILFAPYYSIVLNSGNSITLSIRPILSNVTYKIYSRSPNMGPDTSSIYGLGINIGSPNQTIILSEVGSYSYFYKITKSNGSFVYTNTVYITVIEPIISEIFDLSGLSEANTTNADLTQLIMYPSIFYEIQYTDIPPTLPTGYKIVTNIYGRHYILGSSANLTDADLTGADLSGIDLTNMTINNTIFNQITYTDTDTDTFTLPLGYNIITNISEQKYIVGPNVNLTDVDLTGIDLTSANLTSVNLTGANLTGANLAQAIIYNIIFNSIIYDNSTTLPSNIYRFITNNYGQNYIIGPNINLTGVNLTGIDLTSADLTGANLFEVNLTSANLTNTNLTRANLTGANLTEAIIYNTIFNDITYITNPNTDTTLPSNSYNIVTNTNGQNYIVGPFINLTGADLAGTNKESIETNIILAINNINNIITLHISETLTDVIYQLYYTSIDTINITDTILENTITFNATPITLLEGTYYYYYKIIDIVTGSFVYTNIVQNIIDTTILKNQFTDKLTLLKFTKSQLNDTTTYTLGEDLIIDQGTDGIWKINSAPINFPISITTNGITIDGNNKLITINTYGPNGIFDGLFVGGDELDTNIITFKNFNIVVNGNINNWNGSLWSNSTGKNNLYTAFDNCSSTINGNVGIYNGDFVGCYAGGVIGFGAGYSGGSSTIENCSAIVNGDIKWTAGGVIGGNPGCVGSVTINNCSAIINGNIDHGSGSIIGTGLGTGINVNNKGLAIVTNCFGIINGNVGNIAGGIVGYGAGSENGSATIENCYSIIKGNINGGGGIVGHGAGSTYGEATFTNCYSIIIGNITGIAGGISAYGAGDDNGSFIISKSYTIIGGSLGESTYPIGHFSTNGTTIIATTVKSFTLTAGSKKLYTNATEDYYSNSIIYYDINDIFFTDNESFSTESSFYVNFRYVSNNSNILTSYEIPYLLKTDGDNPMNNYSVLIDSNNTANNCIIYPGANLTGTNLTGINLTNANLTGANLTDANLTGATLTSATIYNTIFNNITYETGTEPTLPNDTYKIVTNSNSNNFIVGPNVNLTSVVLTSADLTDADLSGANLTGAILPDDYSSIITTVELNKSSENTNQLIISEALNNVTYQLYISSIESISGGTIVSGSTPPYTIPNNLSSGIYYYYYKIINTDELSIPNSFIYTNIVQITIEKIDQDSVTITNSDFYETVGTSITLTTSGGSGNGNITYNISPNTYTLTNSDLNVSAPGIYNITATKAGNDIYSPITTDSVSFYFSADLATELIMPLGFIQSGDKLTYTLNNNLTINQQYDGSWTINGQTISFPIDVTVFYSGVTIDGNSKLITINTYENTESFNGLFVGGGNSVENKITFKNFNIVVNGNINDWAGSLWSNAKCITNLHTAFDNCSSTINGNVGIYSGDNSADGSYAGGIIGYGVGYYDGSTTISNCFTIINGNIKWKAGGVIGTAAGYRGVANILNCSAIINGNVEYGAGSVIGSGLGSGTIIDSMTYTGLAIVTNCFGIINGNIEGTAGGIIGYNAGAYYGSATISNCYSIIIGNIEGIAGGIVGLYAGSVFGSFQITNSYSIIGGTLSSDGYPIGDFFTDSYKETANNVKSFTLTDDPTSLSTTEDHLDNTITVSEYFSTYFDNNNSFSGTLFYVNFRRGSDILICPIPNLLNTDPNKTMNNYNILIDSNNTNNNCIIYPGADLSGINFFNANLSNANLINANFTNANLTQAKLTNNDLTNANFTNANLYDTDLTNSILTNIILKNAITIYIYTWSSEQQQRQLPDNYKFFRIDPDYYENLFSIIGPYINCSTINLAGNSFNYANLTGVNLTGADLSWCDLTGADLTETNFTGANFTDAYLTDAIINNTIFNNIRYDNFTRLPNSTYKIVNRFIVGPNVNLSGTNLTYANLININLSNANLTGANLSWANLTDANLTGANLTNANLSNVDLSNANLTGTNLSWANLSETNLTGANLNGTNLSYATINNTKINNIEYTNEPTLRYARINNTNEPTLPYDTYKIVTNFNSDNFIVGPNVNLSGADLTNVNLTGVDLTGANLTGADLTDVTLTNTILTDANLTGVDLFSSIKTQLIDIDDKQQIIVYQDINVPTLITATTFTILTDPIVLDLPNIALLEKVEKVEIVNLTQLDGAKYILAKIETPIDITINSVPVLFSLYYKALNSNFETVVTTTNPFIINLTLNNINSIIIYKYYSGNYTELIENDNYNIEKNDNIFTISLYSNSYISFTIASINSVNYIGDSDGIWSQASNWSSSIIPNSNNVANVIIPENITVIYDNNYNYQGNIEIASGAIFKYSSSIDQTLSGVISGEGSVVKEILTSILTLSGANTYTGSTTINAGTLQISNNGSLGTDNIYAGDIEIASGATFKYLSSIDQILSGVISGAGSVVKEISTSILTLSNANTYTGSTTISAGTLEISDTGSLGTDNIYAGSIAINSGATFKYSSSIDQTLSGVISGAGSIVKGSSSIVSFSGKNTYTGSTTISAGTLEISDTGSLGTGNIYVGSIAINSGAIFKYSSSVNQTLSGVISGTGSVVKEISTIILTLSGANTYTGSTTINAGTLQISNNGSLGTDNIYAGDIVIESGATFKYSSSIDQTLSGVISGAGSIVKDTSNSTLTLSGANTYTGPITTTVGILDNNGNISTGKIIPTVTTHPIAPAITYGDSLSNSTLSDGQCNVPGTFAFTSPSIKPNAGNSYQSITFIPLDTYNYNTLIFDISVSVTPKKVTLSASKTYNGTTTLNGDQIIIGNLVSGESLTYTDATCSDANVETIGKYINTITLANGTDGSLSTNYSLPDLDSTNAPVTIDRAQLICSSDNISSIYGSDPIFTYTVQGFVGSDTIENSMTGTIQYICAGSNTSDVGTYTITPYGLSSNNYNIQYNNGTLTISKKPLTCSVENTITFTKTYDGLSIGKTTNLSGIILNGVKNSDDSDNNKLKLNTSFTFNDKNVGENKEITLDFNISGSKSQNYQLTTPSNDIINASITKASLIVTANNSSKLQSTDDPIFTYTIIGFVNSESENSLNSDDYTKLNIIRTNASNNNAGIYTGVLVPTNGLAKNYTFTYNSGDFTIIGTGTSTLLINNTNNFTYGTSIYPESLTGQYINENSELASITFTKVSNNSYSGNDHTGNSIILMLNLSNTNKLNVGSYTISATITNSNFTSYALAYSTITIDKKNITLEISDSISKTYDGTNVCNNFSVSSSDIITGDVVSFVNNSTYANSNVGEAIIIYALFSLSGIDSDNYSLTQPTDITGTITPKSLTISGITISDKTYDGTVEATISGTLSLVGVIYGDYVTIDDSNKSVIFSDKNVGTNIPISISDYTLSGDDKENYSLTQPTGIIGTITPKSLTILGINILNKTYDGTVEATIRGTLSLEGIVGTDDVIIDDSSNSSRFNDKNVGTNIPISISGYTLSGNDKENYSLAQPIVLTASITKAPLTITANNSSKLQTTPDPTFTYTIIGFVNSESENSLILDDYTKPTITRTNIDNDYIADTYSGVLVPANGLARNYTFAYVTGDFTIIGPGILLINNTNNFTYGTSIYPNELTGRYINENNENNELVDIIFNKQSDNSYSGNDITLTFQLTNYIYSTANKLNVGSYAISATITNSNFISYNLAYSTITIDKKNITLEIPNLISKTYDGTNVCNNFSVSSSDIIEGDNVLFDNVSFVNNSTYANSDVGKNIIINGLFSLTGIDSANYSLTQPTGITGEIIPKPLSININSNQTKQYGSVDPTFTYAVEQNSGLISGDTLTGSLSREVGENVGTYVITIGTLINSNYTISLSPPPKTFTITSATLTIIPNNKTIYSSQNDPNFDYTYMGLLNSDQASVIKGTLTTSNSDRVIGEKYLINYGLEAANYNIIYQPAYLNIIAPPTTSETIFNKLKEQLTNIQNNSENNQPIVIFKDNSVPTLITATTFTILNEPINLDLPNIAPIDGSKPSPLEKVEIANLIQLVGAEYILAKIETPKEITTINSVPVLFSLYYKALNDNFVSVVTKTNPFTINVTLNNINSIIINKYNSNGYVQLIENDDYNIEKNTNIFTISLYSNSYISFTGTPTAVVNDQASISNNIMVLIPSYQLFIGKPFNILQYNSHINPNIYNFYSSDTTIATIDNFGIITPIKIGYFFFTIENFQNKIVFTSNSMQVLAPTSIVKPSIRKGIDSNIIEQVAQPITQNTIQPIIQNTIQPIIQNTIQPIIQPTIQPIVNSKLLSFQKIVSLQILQKLLSSQSLQKILSLQILQKLLSSETSVIVIPNKSENSNLLTIHNSNSNSNQLTVRNSNSNQLTIHNSNLLTIRKTKTKSFIVANPNLNLLAVINSKSKILLYSNNNSIIKIVSALLKGKKISSLINKNLKRAILKIIILKNKSK
jgi:autotransporter-associated beta strand protein